MVSVSVLIPPPEGEQYVQNFSAMLRDEVGGKATNLTNNAVMEDIYRRVADKAHAHLLTLDDDEGKIVSRWVKHGVSRTVVKRAVMTTPYGVTKRSAVNYVMEDYLKTTDNPFDTKEYLKASQVLMDSVWPAIGQVVVKSREAMDWLRSCAKAIIKERGEDEEGVITWVTPSGFVATQAYYAVQEHRINTKLHGSVKLKVLTETDDASSIKHASGLAPNFVHSMDASHLHLTASKCASLGIDALAMIHDDYGTHAADAQQLYEIIRSEFVKMYEENDPVVEFATQYPECPPPPSKGELNLREVLDSHYFFS